MLLLLLFLAAVPIFAYWFAHKRYPSRAFLITGIALGLIISPLNLGLYATFFIPYVGLVPGMFGLMLTMFHSAPGYGLAIALVIIPAGQVVEGIPHYTLLQLMALFGPPLMASLGGWPTGIAPRNTEVICMGTAKPAARSEDCALSLRLS